MKKACVTGLEGSQDPENQWQEAVRNKTSLLSYVHHHLHSQVHQGYKQGIQTEVQDDDFNIC